MQTPLVTIIMPAYNAQDYLPTAIESALAQDHPQLEVIVVDDGSTDDTGVLLDQYAQKDARLQVVKSSNQGQGHARNVALDQAHGDYVLFLDSDDYLAPNTVSKLLEAFRPEDPDFVLFPYRHFINSPSEQSEPIWDYYPESGLYAGEKTARLLTDNAYFACNKAYRRAFLEKHSIRFGEGYIYEDNPFFLSAVLHASSAVVVRDPVYCVRDNSDSSIRSAHDSEKHARSYIAATRACVDLFAARADKPHIDAFKYDYALYACRKFRRYYYERTPKSLRRWFAKEFLGCMHDLGSFPALDSSDRSLTFFIRNQVFARKKLLPFRAVNYYMKRLRPAVSRAKR